MKKSLVARLRQSNVAKGIAGAALLAGASASFADSTAATAAITQAQTDALAVVGGLLAMSIAVWGAGYLIRFFGKK